MIELCWTLWVGGWVSGWMSKEMCVTQAGGWVGGWVTYLVEVLVCVPVLVEDEHQFLRSAEGKNGEEATPSPSHDLGHFVCRRVGG